MPDRGRIVAIRLRLARLLCDGGLVPDRLRISDLSRTSRGFRLGVRGDIVRILRRAIRVVGRTRTAFEKHVHGLDRKALIVVLDRDDALHSTTRCPRRPPAMEGKVCYLQAPAVTRLRDRRNRQLRHRSVRWESPVLGGWLSVTLSGEAESRTPLCNDVKRCSNVSKG